MDGLAPDHRPNEILSEEAYEEAGLLAEEAARRIEADSTTGVLVRLAAALRFGVLAFRGMVDVGRGARVAVFDDGTEVWVVRRKPGPPRDLDDEGPTPLGEIIPDVWPPTPEEGP